MVGGVGVLAPEIEAPLQSVDDAPCLLSLAHISAATYRLLTLLRVYDEEGCWQGCRSCAHWLSWRTGLSPGPAREKVRVARCLPSLPLISAAFAKGELPYSKVRALTRVATADNEAELLNFADHGTTAHVERLVREWRRLDRSDDCPTDRADRRGLSLHLGDDGNYEIRGQLSPEVGALLLKALEGAEDKLYREQRAAGTEHETSAAQRRADAFGLWLEERLQPRVQLVVHSFEAAATPAEAVAPAQAASPITPAPSRVSPETSPSVIPRTVKTAQEGEQFQGSGRQIPERLDRDPRIPRAAASGRRLYNDPPQDTIGGRPFRAHFRRAP